MADLYLIVRLAGRRVAFPAADVEAVVELEGLSPVPCALPHVAGLSALRSRIVSPAAPSCSGAPTRM
jgi:purine-binding chemotaxis protein CheW